MEEIQRRTDRRQTDLRWCMLGRMLGSLDQEG